jgi:chaperonin GroEL (HSP60 family)
LETNYKENIGIDMEGNIKNMSSLEIYDLLTTKIEILKNATEIACSILQFGQILSLKS